MMSNLIEVSKCHLGSITKPFLSMLTRNLNICPLQPPPVRKALAVIQARKSTPHSFFPTINFSIVSNWNPNLQSVSIDFKFSLHAVPGTRVIFILHPVPIFTFLMVWMSVFSNVSPHVNGGLSVHTTVSFWTILWTPFTIVSHGIQFPLKKGEILLHRREFVGETSL